MRALQLQTPPLPLLVSAETFDDFGWCPSDVLPWQTPGSGLVLNPFVDTLPLRMAFVFVREFPALPREYAWLHTGRDQATALGLGDAFALAPYALDDATDLLWEAKAPPRTVFSLACDNLNALYWALHDWSHFHNHGPFTDRPSTELQCDVAALAWLWINRDALPLPPAVWDDYRRAALDNHLVLRASEPGTRCPAPTLLADAEALQRLADNLLTNRS